MIVRCLIFLTVLVFQNCLKEAIIWFMCSCFANSLYSLIFSLSLKNLKSDPRKTCEKILQSVPGVALR